MNVHIFRAFPDRYRKSMQIYADQLLGRIAPLLDAGETIRSVLPPDIRLNGRLARYWDQYVRYQMFSRSHAGDVNHVVDPGYGHLVHALPAHRTLATFHDAVIFKVGGISPVTKLAFRYSLTGVRKAAMVLADSASSRRDFLSAVDYPEDRVRVVHLGVDQSFRVPVDRDEVRRRYRLRGPCMMHIGHNQSYMNVETALRACAALVRKHDVDITFLKAGEPLTAKQELLVDSLNIRSRLLHLGRVPFAELPDVYAGADVLVYPARYAGFGMPPLEAMACGTPVVCSNRGSLPEIVGEAAIVTEADDDEEIARQVARLLAEPVLREAYRARGLARVRLFSWDATAAATLAAYRDVAQTQAGM